MRKLLMYLAAAGLLLNSAACTLKSTKFVISYETKSTKNTAANAGLWKSFRVGLTRSEMRELVKDGMDFFVYRKSFDRQELLNSEKYVKSVFEVFVELPKENPRKELLELLEEALQDMQSKPKIEDARLSLSVPKSISDIVADDNKIHLTTGIVKSITNTIHFNAIGSYESTISKNVPFYFASNGTLFGIDKEFKLIKISVHPFMVSLNQNTPSLVYSLAADFYAYQLAKANTNNIVWNINKLGEKYERLLELEEINSIVSLWRERYHMASYALAYAWMSDFGAKKSGMKVPEIEDRLKYNKEFNRIILMAKEIGLKEFMDLYKNNPYLIFYSKNLMKV